MSKYKYEYLKLRKNISPDEMDAAINEVAEKGFRLIQIIPNYAHWVGLPEDGESWVENTIVIFEKPVE
jgi:hypothetical protein